MDKIITVFSFIQNYVRRPSERTEDAEKPDRRNAAKYRVEPEAHPVHNESGSSAAGSFEYDSKASRLNSTNGGLESHLSGEITDNTAASTSKFPKPAAKKPVSRFQTQNSGVSETNWFSPLGGKFVQDKCSKGSLENTRKNKAKIATTQVVLPSRVETAQLPRITSTSKNAEAGHDQGMRSSIPRTSGEGRNQPKRERLFPGLDDGFELPTGNTEKKNNRKKKGKGKGKAADKKVLASDGNNKSSLPDIFSTAGKSLVHTDRLRVGFLDNVLRSKPARSQAGPGLDALFNDKACGSPLRDKGPAQRLPKLEHKSHKKDKKDTEVFLEAREQFSGKPLQEVGKPAEDSVSGVEQNGTEIKGTKQQRNRPPTALKRWIKKRSNSVAPAPSDDTMIEAVIEMPDNGPNRASSNAGQGEDNISVRLGSCDAKETSKGRPESPAVGSFASVQPCKTVFVKQREENISALPVKENRRYASELTKQEESRRKTFDSRESLNVLDNQSCKGLFRKEGGLLDDSTGLTTEHTAVEKRFNGVTGRPASTLGRHSGVTGQQSTLFANSARDSPHSSVSLPKLDCGPRGCSSKPRLSSITELQEPMEESFANMPANKKGRGEQDREGRRGESRFPKVKFPFERPVTAKTPSVPKHLGTLAGQRTPTGGGDGFSLGLSSPVPKGRIFSEPASQDLSGRYIQPRSRNQPNVHLNELSSQPNSTKYFTSGASSHDPSRGCDLHDQLAITDFDDDFDF